MFLFVGCNSAYMEYLLTPVKFSINISDLPIEKIKNAIDLHPNIRQYYDNYIIANYEVENYKAIDQIAQSYIESFQETSPNILYMLAKSTYISSDEERDNACQILKDLNSNNLYSFNISEFDMCF